MRIVRVAHEREPAHVRHVVLAPRPALDERGMQIAAERAEARAVEIEAADLAAERVDVVVRFFARVEREALHGVEIDVEARLAA